MNRETQTNLYGCDASIRIDEVCQYGAPMLSIRDREVRILAEAVMRSRGAPNLTAAIKLALLNEVRRAEEAIPLRDRVAAIRAQALLKAERPARSPLTEEERDDLWGA